MSLIKGETEVKTLESIREEIWEEMLRIEDKRLDQWADIKYQTLREVLQKLGHLDEPEVLSQEFINEHKVARINNLRKMTMSDVVPVDKLQNLLVPKQEITEEQAWEKISEYYPVKQAGLKSAFEHFYYGGFMTDVVVKKPTIPQFVADIIEELKASSDSLDDAFSILRDVYYQSETADWIAENKRNSETFALAWVSDYEVEQEPKFHAKVKGWGINGNDGKAFYNGSFPQTLSRRAESVPHTLEEWRDLGIYEDNADFLKVEEPEE